MKLVSVVFLAFLLGVAPAHAAAPPAGSPQAEELAPFGDWIKSLHNPTTGQGCCSISDCRAPQYRITADGYEAFIDHETYPGGPDKWLKVPASVILHTANDTGLPIACWAAWHGIDNGFFCFAAPGEY